MIDVPTLRLLRTSTGDDGTFGQLMAPADQDGGEVQIAHTAELPWRENLPFRSCVPAGTYLLARDFSPSKGRRWHLLDVPERARCMIHVGNWAGDIEVGKRTDVTGCIAPGLELGVLDEQRCVLNSKRALTRIEEYLELVGGYAWLQIEWAEGVLPLGVVG